ncbi:hypothetical protein BH10ACT11_BH10ACT11_01160 [soil metagenome]
MLFAPAIGDLLPSNPIDFFASLRSPYANQPEPTEFTRYVIAALAPVVVAALTLRLGETPPPRWSRQLVAPSAVVVPGVLVLGLVYAWKERATLDRTYASSFDYFTDRHAVVALLFAVALALAAVHPAARRIAAGVDAKRALRIAAPIAAVVVVALFLLPVVETNGSYRGTSPFVSFHLVNTLADFEAVVNGATPGVDFAPQYSTLAAYALGPIFDAFGFEPGPLIAIFTLLTSLIFLAFYRILVLVTRSSVAAVGLFVPVVALSLTPTAGTGVFGVTNANTFQVMPIRYLGPALVALLFVHHLRREGGARSRMLIFLVAGLAAISTPDFGSASIVAAALAFAVLSPFADSPRRELGLLLRDLLVGIAAALALFALLTVVRSGSLPKPSLMLYFPELFGSRGFGLIPMDTVGLYWFLYVTFAGGMILSAVRTVGRRPDRVLTGSLAFFSTLGLAAGVYYVGRTNPFTLIADFPIWGMTLALLSWIVLRGLAEGGGGIRTLSRIGVLRFLVLFGIGLAITAIGWVHAPWKEADRLQTGNSAPTELDVGPIADFMKSKTEPGERVVIICRSAYLAADRAEIRNVNPIGDPEHIVEDEQIDFITDSLNRVAGSQVFTCPNSLLSAPDVDAGLADRGFVRGATDKVAGVTQWTYSAGS